MYDIFRVGIEYAYLMAYPKKGHTVKSKTKDEASVLGKLKILRGFLENCRIYDWRIVDPVNKWIKLLTKKYTVGVGLEEVDADSLRHEFYGKWDILVEILSEQAILTEAPEGIISHSKLREGLGGFIDRDIIKALWRIPYSDFNDALKCLRVGAWTPAVMVMLRGVEFLLREYYKLKTSKPIEVDGKYIGWKEIIDELMNAPEAKRSLVGHLDYIRERRNEAEHPDKIFNQNEAEKIFMVIIGTAEEIMQEVLTHVPLSPKELKTNSSQGK